MHERREEVLTFGGEQAQEPVHFGVRGSGMNLTTENMGAGDGYLDYGLFRAFAFFTLLLCLQCGYF